MSSSSCGRRSTSPSHWNRKAKSDRHVMETHKTHRPAAAAAAATVDGRTDGTGAAREEA
jgi:hypothetical protein